MCVEQELQAPQLALQINRLPSGLVALASRGPVSRTLSASLSRGVLPTAPPQVGADDHLALLLHDGERILVRVHGDTHVLVVQHGNRYNWVEGGAVRFPAREVERMLLLTGHTLDWETRSKLCRLMQQPASPDPASIQAALGSQAMVLIGKQAPEDVVFDPDQADEDDLFDLLSEVAELDHRATPTLVRRIAEPGARHTPDAWRLADDLFEAPDFEAPTREPTPLELILVVDRAAALPSAPDGPDGPQQPDELSLDPEPEPTDDLLHEEPTLKAARPPLAAATPVLKTQEGLHPAIVVALVAALALVLGAVATLAVAG